MQSSRNFGIAVVLVLSLALAACQQNVAPEAVSPESEPPGSARPPSLEPPETRETEDAGIDCDSDLKRASDLASRCFRLFPDDNACTEFFGLQHSLVEAGCVSADAGQNYTPLPE